MYAYFVLFAALTQQKSVAASALTARGYSVIPEPQSVELKAGDVRIAGSWRLKANGIDPGDPAIETVREYLGSRLSAGSAAGQEGSVELLVRSNSVTIGQALDKDKNLLQEQAYSLEIGPKTITISANASAGLFYGAQTLAQLLKRDGSDYRLPQGRITDWPDLQRRHIYWDDAHHLDRLEYLKHALRTAAFFKINGIALKLEGHFQFKSAPAIVEPWALTPEQYQELTNYGLRYHVQLIPYLDAPAHVAFVLKHPEYARLRAWENNNYEFCVTNPDTYKLLFSMFDDLLAANRGVQYFYLSTDEAYYVGKPNTAACNEADSAKKLGSNGKLLADFVQRTADYLHSKGRTASIWGEFPLRREDIGSLPNHIINGEVNGPDIDRLYRSRGIRQTIYIAVEGEEKLFPEYFPVAASDRLHAPRGGNERVSNGRVAEAFNKIAQDSARENADLLGAVVAAWGDMGLHTETFWLGYATATSAAWNPRADPRALMGSFYPLYFGNEVVRMDRAFQLLSQQARFWNDSWETAPAQNRTAIVGNSYGLFPTPMPARDQHLPLPPIPSASDLSIPADWAAEHKRLLELSSQYRTANDEVTGLLQENLRLASRNHHALEVFLSIAKLCRENLDYIEVVAATASRMNGARRLAADGKPEQAVAQLDRTLDAIERYRKERNRVFHDVAEVWGKSWHLRAPEANGRRFLHRVDDVKDHLPDRTADMSYLIYRELKMPVQEWFDELLKARNAYAMGHNVTARNAKLAWSDTEN